MKLTIGIATYNRNVMLKNLLMSMTGLMKRHPEDLEVIVVNDGGAEGKNIDSFCKSLNGYVSNLRFIDREENWNIFRTRYQLLSEATGDYFMFADDDDFVDTITIHEWLTKMDELINCTEDFNEKFGDLDAYVFNMLEFHHKSSGPGCKIFNKYVYYSTKTKMGFGLNSVIWNWNKLKVNLPLLKEAIDNLDRHTKNIGEDTLCAFNLVGRNKNVNVKVIDNVIAQINYDMSFEHMAFIDRDKNYVDNINSMRLYTKPVNYES